MAAVLIIDDDPDIRSLLTMALELDGHEVVAATTAAAALDVLRERASAGESLVVVLDVQMPGMDGWEVLRTIRTDERITDAAVILCTVTADLADEARGWAEGIDAYRTKPFDIAEVSAEVTALAQLDPSERRAKRDQRAAETT